MATVVNVYAMTVTDVSQLFVNFILVYFLENLEGCYYIFKGIRVNVSIISEQPSYNGKVRG